MQWNDLKNKSHCLQVVHLHTACVRNTITCIIMAEKDNHLDAIVAGLPINNEHDGLNRGQKRLIQALLDGRHAHSTTNGLVAPQQPRF